jgi:hypothetical protein
VLAGVAPKLATLLAQHGTAIAAGALSGAVVGGAGVATGIVPTGGASSGSTLALLACPGTGAQIARITSGEPLLVTARSADGAWLQIYIPGPGIDRGWAPAAALKMQAAVSGLPVADCSLPETPGPATPAPLGSPSPVATQLVLPTELPTPVPSATTGPSATLKPTAKPTKTPKPTPVPTSFKDANPPAISELDASNNGQHCFSDFADLSVTVTDADPSDTLTVAVHVVPASGTPIDDEFTGGPPYWEYSFYRGLDWSSGVVKWTVTVTDSTGNVTKATSSSNSSDLSWIWYENGGPCPTPLPT